MDSYIRQFAAFGALFWLFTIVGCSTTMSNEGKLLSATKLLKDAKKFDGKRVVAEGYLRWDLEDQCLFETLEDMRLERTDNSVWLEARPGFEAARLNGKRVIVVGVFSKNEVGHMSMWEAGLIVESINAAADK